MTTIDIKDPPPAIEFHDLYFVAYAVTPLTRKGSGGAAVHYRTAFAGFTFELQIDRWYSIRLQRDGRYIEHYRSKSLAAVVELALRGAKDALVKEAARAEAALLKAARELPGARAELAICEDRLAVVASARRKSEAT